MEKKFDFYASGPGDHLVESSFFPKEIVLFLEKEKEIVQEALRASGLLFEVGCMEGRYLDVALSEGKKYFGIDLVERYVKKGNEVLSKKGLPTSDFVIQQADASSIDEVFSKNNLDRALVIFPFNSFGNMVNKDDVIASLARTRKPFLIFTYNTDALSNDARLQYYKNCGYKNIRYEENDEGVRFFSDEGLNTIAYKEDYIKNEFKKMGIDIEGVRFSNIGIVYQGFFNPQ